jgi:hypothetical protein
MKLGSHLQQQIEMRLVSDARPRRQTPRTRPVPRRQRALWWFREMHRVVDGASMPTPARPGEQPGLALQFGR